MPLEGLVVLLAMLASATSLRLPASVTPLHYDVTLLPVLETRPRLCGNVWIDVVAHSDHRMVVLNAADIDVANVVMVPLNQANETQPLERTRQVEQLCFDALAEEAEEHLDGDIVSQFRLNRDVEWLSIELNEALVVGQHYRIGVLYEGKVFDDGKAFFRTHYVTEPSCCQKWVGGTQMEPTDARRVFPCFDEPNYKATFQVTVGHWAALTALSNMPLLSSSTMVSTEGWVWDQFHRSPLMSTFLVAVVLTDYQYVERRYHTCRRTIQLRFWAEPNQLHKLEFAAELAPKILRFFENYLEIAYQLPKLDVIVIPGYDLGRAMENWGLIVHSEMNLMVDYEAIDSKHRSFTATFIAHELAHQWFGNLVTCHWWDDIWLNEGLATLFSNIAVTEVAPEHRSSLLLASLITDSLRMDSAGSSTSLDFYVDRPKEIVAKFNPATYAKSAVVLNMLRQFMGHKTFRKGLARYFKQYKYLNANSSQLWSVLNQEARQKGIIGDRMNVAAIMKTWTAQNGYPIVHCHRTVDNKLRLYQKRFEIDPDSWQDSNVTSLWWVPIRVTDAKSTPFGATTQTAWLSPRRPDVELEAPHCPNVWVLVNYEMNGFFRVNYDRRNWQLLAMQLRHNHTKIGAVTRGQLIDDAFFLAHAGIIDYEIPHDLIKYLDDTDEEEYVIGVASNHLRYLEAMSSEETSTNETNYSDSIQRVLSPDVIHSELFQAQMNDSTRISSEQLETVWCSAIKNGDQLQWKFAWKTINQPVNSDKMKMLKAMACSTEPRHLKQLLSRVFQPEVNQSPAETWTIIKAVAAHPPGRSMAFNFVVKHWQFFSQHFSNASLKYKLLASVTRYTKTTRDFEKVKQLLEDDTQHAISSEILNQIRTNIKRSSGLPHQNELD